MFKSITFALAFTATMILSPSAKDQKEIAPHPVTLVDVAFADVAPCPAPTVLVTIKPVEVAHVRVVKAKPKPKKKFTSKPKKKLDAHGGASKHKPHVPDHHKSSPSHGSHGPTKIPPSHAPLHVTGPPGCN